jgi:hypothetical protein
MSIPPVDVPRITALQRIKDHRWTNRMRQFWEEQPASWLLVLLLSTDLLFMVLHSLHTSPLLDNPNLSVIEDRGFAAAFQYVKQYWIIVLLLWLFLRHWKALYVLWMCLFSYILIIDGFKPHRTDDLSALVVLTAPGAFLFGVIAIVYWFSTDEVQHVSRQIAKLLAAFLFFAVVVDSLPWSHEGLELVERTGELTMMSLVCWYLVTQLVQPHTVDEFR